MRRGGGNPQLPTIALQTAIIVGTDKDDSKAIQALMEINKFDATEQQIILRGIGEGLKRRGLSVQALLKKKTTPDYLNAHLQNTFTKAEAVAIDSRAELPHRISAIQLLAFSHLDSTSTRLAKLLTAQTPQAMQIQVSKH